MPRPSPNAEAYALLGVAPGVDDAALKAAYRARVRATHPDLVALEGAEAIARAEARTKALNEAYDLLKRERAHAPGVSARSRVGAAPPTAHEALRAAQVALGLAETCAQRWRNHARALRRAGATLLAERARLAELPGAAPAPEDAAREVRAAAAAVVDARLAQPILALMARDAAAARHRFSTLNTAHVLAVAAEAEAAAQQVRDRVSRQASQAEGRLRRMVSTGARAQEAGRSARRAAKGLTKDVPAARASVESAVVAAAQAAGLARVEAAAADATGAVAARRNQERAAVVLAHASRLEREQVVGEEEAQVAPARASELAAAAREMVEVTRDPERAADAWRAAARAARHASLSAVEQAMTAAERRVSAALG